MKGEFCLVRSRLAVDHSEDRHDDGGEDANKDSPAEDPVDS